MSKYNPSLTELLQTAVQHHAAGRLPQAESLYRQILGLNPNHPDALHLLGVLAGQVNRLDIAADLISRSIAINPNLPDSHNNLGNILRDKGQLTQAADSYRRAISLQPNYPEAYSNLGNILKDIGQLDEAIAAHRRAMALKPGLAGAHSNLIFALHFHPAYDARAIAAELSLWNHRHAEPLRNFIAPHANDRDPQRRLRIGYVSPDFRSHVVGQFLLPLLAHHDKSQVEVFAYAHTHAADALTERLRQCTDVWRNIVDLSDTQAADVIRQDRIDILVDLAMHTAHNRLLIFAHKPAPVQVTYLAYCSSSGLATMDYRLSDPYLDPLGTDESPYSERTIRLPDTYWCYRLGIEAPVANPLPALERGFITFGCLNNFSKVSAPVLAAWAQILRTVPNAQLLLHAQPGAHRQRVLDFMQREGIDAQRVGFSGLAPAKDYFQLYHGIDISLDTFPYGGGTTTCDALWMGVPVISLAGHTAAGRGGVSILTNVGLPELAAGDSADYIRIAAELATDLLRLSQLRGSLRRRMEQSPLMNAPAFAKNVEAAYRRMWHAWCSGA